MGNWREETASDLARAEEGLEGLVPEIRGEPTEEQERDIWLSYLRVEKSIAFIKVDTREENPGRFIKVRAYSVPDERQALQFALRNLKKGSASFRVGDFKQALRELRESRNYLRALLRELALRKERVRRARPGA
ncbi:MAG: hypothetical protein HY247_02650 [archaeon]|nr:MAG: hypothetical protein HY247_02650 [archaeon]